MTGEQKPNIVNTVLLLTWIIMALPGCSSNKESSSSHADSDENSSATAGKSIDNSQSSHTNSQKAGSINSNSNAKKITPEEKIASFTGQWTFADFKTAKTKWEKFLRQTSKKKTNLTTGSFIFDLESGRLDSELKRAAELGAHCVMKIESGNYSINVKFPAGGYSRKEKGVIAWHSAFNGYGLGAANPGNVLTTAMYQIDDCLVGGGMLPFPNYWCMVRKK